MRSSWAIKFLVSILAFCATIAVGHAHSLANPDKVITLEVSERNVERLAKQIESILVAHGFTRLSGTARMEVKDFPRPLPRDASAEEGIVLSMFERKSVISLFVQVTACRADRMH